MMLRAELPVHKKIVDGLCAHLDSPERSSAMKLTWHQTETARTALVMGPALGASFLLVDARVVSVAAPDIFALTTSA